MLLDVVRGGGGGDGREEDFPAWRGEGQKERPVPRRHDLDPPGASRNPLHLLP